MGKASEKTATAVEKIGVSADKTAQGIKKVTLSMKELLNVQKMLTTAFGQPVSRTNALRFVNGFSDMQSGNAGRGIIGLFPSAAEWANQNEMMHSSAKAADSYFRRTVNQAAARGGMSLRISPVMPSAPGGGGGDAGPEPEAPPEGKPYDYAGKAKSMAMDMSKAMLALAGLQGVMALAGQAINLGTTEAMQADTLKRMMGDSGVNYTTLRDSFRNSRDGLGMSSGDMSRLGISYARGAGLDSSANIAGEVRTAAGFGRSYGIEPDHAAGFFSTMRREGVTSSDTSNRRLALMIAEAMDRGKVGSRTEEFLNVVSGFVQQAARGSFQQANVEQFMSYLSSLTGKGIAGVDIEGAAGMLSTADANFRRGGSKGEASLNAITAALHKAHPGLSPFDLMALMEGGMGGTMASTFGGNTIGGAWRKQFGMKDLSGMGSNTTNAEAMYKLLRSQGRPEWQIADSLSGIFGLNKNQGMAMDMILHEGGGKFGNIAKSLAASNIDIGSISATGFQTLGRIQGASASGLDDIRKDMLGRDDITQQEKESLSGLTGETLRSALTGIAARHNQEMDPGLQILQANKDIEQTLTNIGGGLAKDVAHIKEAIDDLVKYFTGKDSTKGDQEAIKEVQTAGSFNLPQHGFTADDPDYNAQTKKTLAKLKSNYKPLSITPEQFAIMQKAAGGDMDLLQDMLAVAGNENFGVGKLNFGAIGKKVVKSGVAAGGRSSGTPATYDVAFGPFQITQATFDTYKKELKDQFGVTDIHQLMKPEHLDASSYVQARYLGTARKKFGNNVDAINSYYAGMTGLEKFKNLSDKEQIDVGRRTGVTDYEYKTGASLADAKSIIINIYNTDGSKTKKKIAAPAAAGTKNSSVHVNN